MTAKQRHQLLELKERLKRDSQLVDQLLGEVVMEGVSTSSALKGKNPKKPLSDEEIRQSLERRDRRILRKAS